MTTLDACLRGLLPRRRGVVIAQVAVFMVVLLGFAALSIDVGAMYNARAELQRTADASAMAAAARLSDYSTGDPMQLARDTAIEYANANGVFGRPMQLDSGSDIIFLRSNYDVAAHSFSFTPTNNVPDAVRVRVRMTQDSPNGALSLYFARALGRASADVSAAAVAMMVPRDMAIVADLSASHTDDSELRHFPEVDINMWDVWDHLPGGGSDIGTGWDMEDLPPEWADAGEVASQTAGPAWGYMERMGFGETSVGPGYDPVTDPGLIRLGYREAFSSAQLSNFLGDQGYNAAEVNAIMNTFAGESSTTYSYRTAVALGLAFWNSGIAGGRWSTMGLPAGNGNNTVTGTELVWSEQIMGRSVADSQSLWIDYIRNYAMSTSNYMYQADSDFRYRYGVKSFLNYLMETRPQNNQTPEFVSTPTQPMQAIKDSVGFLMQYLTDLNTDDHASLEIYATTVRHEVDLTDDFLSVSNRLNEMQAGHYDRNTNIGGGIEAGIAELTGVRARPAAKKVMILMTDGIANVNEAGAFDEEGAHAYAVAAAQAAVDQGIRIFTIAVGSAADASLMAEIAAIGGGTTFVAMGSIDQYSTQLQAIFNTLGGLRPIQLVE